MNTQLLDLYCFILSMFVDQVSLSCFFVFQLAKRLLVVSDNLDTAFSSCVAGVKPIDDANVTSYPPWQPEEHWTHPVLHTTVESASPTPQKCSCL